MKWVYKLIVLLLVKVLLSLKFYYKNVKAGKKGVFGCWNCIMANFDTLLKLPRGYRRVSCFGRLSWRVCKRGMCVTAFSLTYSRIRKPHNYCPAQYYLELKQLRYGKAVYERGIKGISQELKWKYLWRLPV